MHYLIEHETRLTFSTPVREHHCELRLAPQQGAAQRVEELVITTDPPTELDSYIDCFGNQVHHFSLVAPHTHLVTRLRAQVTTLLANPFDYAPVALGREAEWVAGTLQAQPRLWDYLLHRSDATPDLARVAPADFTLPAYDAQVRLIDAVSAARDWVGEEFEYVPGFNPHPVKLAEVLAAREGTSQDLAHLLIAIVRTWGFPARYVVGYQDPLEAEEEGEEVEPREALHAWPEVLIPGAGWRGFDPTTGLIANETYVAVAVGRDAFDAVPQRHSFKGGERADEEEVTLRMARGDDAEGGGQQ